MTEPRRVTCPHCRRTEVRVTVKGFLASHTRAARRSVHCDGSGMSISLITERKTP